MLNAVKRGAELFDFLQAPLKLNPFVVVSFGDFCSSLGDLLHIAYGASGHKPADCHCRKYQNAQQDRK